MGKSRYHRNVSRQRKAGGGVEQRKGRNSFHQNAVGLEGPFNGPGKRPGHYGGALRASTGKRTDNQARPFTRLPNKHDPSKGTESNVCIPPFFLWNRHPGERTWCLLASITSTAAGASGCVKRGAAGRTPHCAWKSAGVKDGAGSRLRLGPAGGALMVRPPSRSSMPSRSTMAACPAGSAGAAAATVAASPGKCPFFATHKGGKKEEKRENRSALNRNSRTLRIHSGGK